MEHHYHSLKHTIWYLYVTHLDGIYFWRTQPHSELLKGLLSTVNSNLKDLLLDDHPQHDTSVAVAYSNSDWATCVKTRHLFSGTCIQLAGGTIAYKTKFQPTVTLSTTEAEFMVACDVGCSRSSSVESSGTSMFLRKWQQSPMKITTTALQWRTLRNPQPALLT